MAECLLPGDILPMNITTEINIKRNIFPVQMWRGKICELVVIKKLQQIFPFYLLRALLLTFDVSLGVNPKGRKIDVKGKWVEAVFWRDDRLIDDMHDTITKTGLVPPDRGAEARRQNQSGTIIPEAALQPTTHVFLL
jgi:hypothetical protein